ncbi:MAG TPA: 23S rRNA (uracil(1939)-C(5))-methyltransferase RlmD [Candidatus Polarisedimenticolaceae bacterium]|nr:23S rRNA (uracil(1939)-C(5))-methyltransferase RlmD [Candidatus Polarisedimenticolaceae bacterium]
MSPPEPKTPLDPAVVDIPIQSWVGGGRGLGRVDGRVWLVPGTVPGDVVQARVSRDHGRWVAGSLVRIVSPSTDRRTPPCPIQHVCGGCPLMPVDEEAQRETKRRFVVDALARIGKLSGVAVDACVGSPRALGYRNKIELTFGTQEGGPVVGYHAAHDPARLVDVEACAIGDGRLAGALAVVRRCLADGTLPVRPGRLVLRASASGPDVLVAFRDGGEPFPEAPGIARALATDVPGLRGVVRLVAAPGRRGGARVETLWGEPWIEEMLLGRLYRVPAGTFLQVNPAAAETLAVDVLSEAGRPAAVLELYGGVGAIGAALAARGARVTVVDADPDAIACGRETTERDGIPVRHVRADVLRFLEGTEGGPNLVVADPPRTGFGPGVAEALARLGPARIVIVSCDPATLARDTAKLSAAGYGIDRVRPFDLFPQTAHVEAVAWLTRRGSPPPPPRARSPRRAFGSH